MGRKEENIKKAEGLLHKKEYIRNIGTAAHIDHGKCVDGSSRILVDDEWIPAGALFGRFSDQPSARESQDEVVKDLHAVDVRVLSLDRGSKKFVESRVTHAWKLRAAEVLFRITVSGMKSVATTPEHKFLTWKNSGFDEVRASDLRVGDVVVVRIPASMRENARQFLQTTHAPFGNASISGNSSLLTTAVPIGPDVFAVPVVHVDYEIADF